jgi:SAM-dependent methyltransferase
MPSFEELQTYYASYSTSSDVKLISSPGTLHERLRRWYHRLTGDVDPRDFVAVSQGTRMLDYGCGAAPYLGHFRARGANISGAEVTPAIVSTYRAAGFDVALIENMERIPFPDEEFDIVYMMQVIEHVARPHEFLSEVRRILRPGGLVYLAMPNALSIWRRVFGANWVAGWFAPFHLFVYSAVGIGKLAQAHGFEVVRSRSSTSDSWLRLNIKAALHPTTHNLDATPRSWLDGVFVRLPLSALLRLVEVAVRERDCLVVELKKC